MSISPIPVWFTDAVNTAYEDRWINVAGCTIHYQLWSDGNQSKPGILLVHGHGANAHWWDFIAPLLIDEYRVAALDVSGAGDSDHREVYSSDLFIAELLAVFQDAGFSNKDFMVGHSFGGRMTRLAGSKYPDSVGGLILVDSAIPLPGQQRRFQVPATLAKPTRYYPSRQEAAKRFRLRPPQPCSNDFIVSHIALHSVRQTPEGWCWKLDPRVFAKMEDLDSSGLDAGTSIRQMACPVAIIYGEKSRFFDPGVRNYLGTLLPAEDLYPVHAAHHHLFLDQPLVFDQVLRDLLSRWQSNAGI